MNTFVVTLKKLFQESTVPTFRNIYNQLEVSVQILYWLDIAIKVLLLEFLWFGVQSFLIVKMIVLDHLVLIVLLSQVCLGNSRLLLF